MQLVARAAGALTCVAAAVVAYAPSSTDSEPFAIDEDADDVAVLFQARMASQDPDVLRQRNYRWPVHEDSVGESETIPSGVAKEKELEVFRESISTVAATNNTMEDPIGTIADVAGIDSGLDEQRWYTYHGKKFTAGLFMGLALCMTVGVQGIMTALQLKRRKLLQDPDSGADPTAPTDGAGDTPAEQIGRNGSDAVKNVPNVDMTALQDPHRSYTVNLEKVVGQSEEQTCTEIRKAADGKSCFTAAVLTSGDSRTLQLSLEQEQQDPAGPAGPDAAPPLVSIGPLGDDARAVVRQHATGTLDVLEAIGNDSYAVCRDGAHLLRAVRQNMEAEAEAQTEVIWAISDHEAAVAQAQLKDGVLRIGILRNREPTFLIAVALATLISSSAKLRSEGLLDFSAIRAKRKADPDEVMDRWQVMLLRVFMWQGRRRDQRVMDAMARRRRSVAGASPSRQADSTYAVRA